MNNIQDYYTVLSDKYDRDRSNPYFKIIEDTEMMVINKILSDETHNILELGCGTGIFLKHLAGKGYNLFGMDYTKGMLQYSKQFVRDEKQNDVSLIQGDGAHLPFADRSFDFIYSLKVLPHIPDLPMTVDEIFRTLKPGSYALLEFYNKCSMRYLFHRGEYFHKWMSPGESENLLRNGGFSIVKRYGARTTIPFSFLANIPLLNSFFRKIESLVYDIKFFNFFSGYQMLLVQKPKENK